MIMCFYNMQNKLLVVISFLVLNNTFFWNNFVPIFGFVILYWASQIIKDWASSHFGLPLSHSSHGSNVKKWTVLRQPKATSLHDFTYIFYFHHGWFHYGTKRYSWGPHCIQSFKNCVSLRPRLSTEMGSKILWRNFSFMVFIWEVITHL